MPAFTPFNFHPHWHLVRPAPGHAFELPPLPILDPLSRQNRRSREAEQRTLSRQHNRQVLALSGRTLSQFELVPRGNGQARLAHCSACTQYNHDKKRCVLCHHIGHNRRNYPFPQERIPETRRMDGIPCFQSQNQLNQPAFALQMSQGQGVDAELDTSQGT